MPIPFGCQTLAHGKHDGEQQNDEWTERTDAYVSTEAAAATRTHRGVGDGDLCLGGWLYKRKIM